ncbi:DNA repair protein RadC [Paenibacillus sp. FSL R5-0345]|uniref:RadC family protein n=1 Tax=Paenibacillus sp. FSL R5-0345 TaxID=1536770 RepID=UPI0004F8F0D4|nr:DNA repair protein RadC [Paenibacillus sp. FSL R5-0345]AIQ37200.1 DNA repair protein RadC [Paenibacillus sp. FSL R5-0345]
MTTNNSYMAIVANTLREKKSSYTVEEIMRVFHTPEELLNATEQELMQIPGIGKIKAQQVLAALELAKLLNTPKSPPSVIRSPQDAYELLYSELAYLQKEHFVCLFLNTKNHIIGQPETISIGSLSSAIVHPREVFRAAIKRSSAALICAHNHPSGDPTPSSEDISLTSRLIQAGEIVGIDVLDHLIIGDSRYVSLKEKGVM